jgi:nickel-type superoxide dismutase maturation protease
MAPTLAPGDRLVVVRRRRPPRPGALVAVADPRAAARAPGGPVRLLVKRLASVTPAGGLMVEGDAAGASTDSRHFGPVPPGFLVGQAVYRYAPLAHSGWLGRPPGGSGAEPDR